MWMFLPLSHVAAYAMQVFVGNNWLICSDLVGLCLPVTCVSNQMIIWGKFGSKKEQPKGNSTVGMQPRIFQYRGVSLEQGYFDKHFV